jgi:hypothetical protein
VTAIATIALLAGALLGGVGAWAAGTGSRPAWFPGRALSPDRARTWGGATALGGAGLAIWGADQLFLGNPLVGTAGVVMMFAGAMWISLATPRARRSK